MANRVAVLAAVLLALAMPRRGAAQDEPAKIPPGAPTASVNGTVLSMGTEELVIETRAGRWPWAPASPWTTRSWTMAGCTRRG
jgi:hypothetical protein